MERPLVGWGVSSLALLHWTSSRARLLAPVGGPGHSTHSRAPHTQRVTQPLTYMHLLPSSLLPHPPEKLRAGFSRPWEPGVLQGDPGSVFSFRPHHPTPVSLPFSHPGKGRRCFPQEAHSSCPSCPLHSLTTHRGPEVFGPPGMSST